MGKKFKIRTFKPAYKTCMKIFTFGPVSKQTILI